MGLLSSIFGGGSKSSSSSSSTTTATSKPTTLQNVRGMSFAGNEVSGGVRVLDGGAIKGIQKVAIASMGKQNSLAVKALNLQAATTKKSLALVNQTQKNQNSLARSVIGFAKKEQSQMDAMARPDVAVSSWNNQTLLILAGIIAAGFVAVKYKG